MAPMEPFELRGSHIETMYFLHTFFKIGDFLVNIESAKWQLSFLRLFNIYFVMCNDSSKVCALENAFYSTHWNLLQISEYCLYYNLYLYTLWLNSATNYCYYLT